MLKDYGMKDYNLIGTEGKQDRDCISMPEENRIVYDNIVAAEQNYLGIDFHCYKESTILRRIERRAGIVQARSLNDYLDQLLTSDTEKDALGKDILVGVTGFFRDEEAFYALGKGILSGLFAEKKKEIRIWCIACSTGEEAYTLAMLAEEYAEKQEREVPFKIFATDANKDAVSVAQRGIYGEEETSHIPESLREKYFNHGENYYRIKDELRRKIVFAQHDVLRDAPFSKIDLIVCRNMFIYLKTEVQRHLLASFYRLLNPEGALFLGSSESVGGYNEAFVQIDSKWKIYQKNLKKSAGMEEEYVEMLERGTSYHNRSSVMKHTRKADFAKLLAKALETVMDAGILVNEKGEILHILNHAGEYMEFPQGTFEKNITACLRGNLGVLVSSMLHRLSSSDEKSISQNSADAIKLPEELLHILIHKINYNDNVFYLIRFQREDASAEQGLELTHDELKNYRIKELEDALESVNQKLQNVVEELESRNEELQSSNEEMIVSNEELQSMNEELQFVNEELHTVNGEYQGKIEELETANSDIANLLVNAQIGALYIDNHLNIRRITPIMEQNTFLRASDEGRSITHVCFMKGYGNFEEEVRASLEKETVIEREIPSGTGITWLIRIRPYYTMTGEKAGALVILFDITKRLEAAQYELKLLMNNVPGGVTKMRYEDGLIIEYANHGMYQMMGMNQEEFSSRYHNYYDRLVVPEDWVWVRQQIEIAIGTGKQLTAAYRVKLPDGGVYWRMMQAMLLEERSAPILQCIISDINDLKETQLQLKSLIDNMSSAVLRFLYDGKEIKQLFLSDRGYQMIGYTKEEYDRARSKEGRAGLFIFQKESGKLFDGLNETIRTGKELSREYHVDRKDGSKIWLSIQSSLVSKEGESYLFQSIITDITELKENMNILWQEREKLNLIAEMSADLIFEYDIKKDRMEYSNGREDTLEQEVIHENYCDRIMDSGLILKEDFPVVRQFCEELRAGKPEIRLEFRKKYADNQFHWSSVHAKTLCDENGVPIRVIGTTANIDEKKLEEELLKERSQRDSLTNLYNHRTINELVHEYLIQKSLEEEAYFLIMDLDNFKSVNDTQGHLFGDAVLCSFADEVRNIFGASLSGRIGGDEFCVLVTGVDEETLCKKMEELNQRIWEIYTAGGNKIQVSSSIGVARFEKESYERGILFKQADMALYHVKNHGKCSYQFYHSEMGEIGNVEHYLNKYEESTMRRNALFSDEQELMVFSLELLDRVKDVQSAAQLIADRVCSFFQLSYISAAKCTLDGWEIKYTWNTEEKEESRFRQYQKELLEKLLLQEERHGERFLVLPAQGSFFCIRMDQAIIQDGYFVFASDCENYDWSGCAGALHRLANAMGGKLIREEERRKKEEHLAFIESYDELTKLPNYGKFLILSESYMEENPEEDFFFTYSDFSNFQYLNEIYGFAIGDQVLCEFVEELKQKCESIVYLCHVNSDHFAALHQGTDKESVVKEYEAIIQIFCNRMSQRYPLCKVVLIAGLSEVDRKVPDITHFIDNANVARKTAKNSAEACCVLFTDRMKRQMERQLEMTANMQSALENQEFKVYLQPKVELLTETVVGAEALVRWVRKDGTMICPDDFITLFERNGFITKVDFYVLEQVLIMLRMQLREKRKMVPISVNFSRKDQEDKDFVKHILSCLEKYDVSAEYLQAEVTESVYLSDLKILNENMENLRKNGIRISIDDFGSGYSSLNILSRVSADVIKLDKQFLDENDKQRSTQEFMKYLVKMIKQLGFYIVAEGVETREQIALLKEAGCDQVQGYYYSKPMPMQEFLEYLEQHKTSKE